MNEQDIILNKKIEKREKIDKILAYILIVILLGCILFIVYLKFIKKEDNVINTENNEHTVKYISLNDIVAQLSNSEVVSLIKSEGVVFNATVSNNAIVITYSKDDDNLNLNIPVIGNELKIEIDNDYKDMITSIYKEIGVITCTFYNSSDSNCRTVLNDTDKIRSGIRFSTEDGKDYVYIDIINGFDAEFNSKVVYNANTIVDVSDTNYKLNINESEIDNITLYNGGNEFKVSGNIKSLNDNNTLSVVVKLYNDNNEVISENKKEYTSSEPLIDSDIFEIVFELNDSLKLDDIKKYSIDVVR